MQQHYFDVPFALSGDVTAIPDPLQTGGTVSFTEGWNYNYQRNLSTDPAALPIDRSTMNWLFLQITTAIQALQLKAPEWITAAQNGGTAVTYPAGAVVMYSASGSAPFTKYVYLATSSDTPGTTSNTQVVVDPIATSAQASAGTNNASIMTPLLVAQQTALRALLAGNSSQVFNVAPATASSQAVQLAQMQAAQGGFSGITTPAAGATLTNSMLGLLIHLGGGNAYTLDTVANFTTGQTLTCVVNSAATNATITPTGTETISYGSGTQSSVTIYPGQMVQFTRVGSTGWRMMGVPGAAIYPLNVAAATAAAHAVQLAQLQAAQTSFAGVSAPAAGATLLASTYLGQLISVGGGNTYTLDSVANLTTGQGLAMISNSSSSNTTINSQGSDVILVGTTSQTSVTIYPGQFAEFVRVGANTWRMFGLPQAAILPLNVAAATASTHSVQLQQAQALRRQFTNYLTYSAAATLTVANITGAVTVWTGTSAAALTLPDVTTMVQNNEARFENLGSAAVTLTCFSGQTVTVPTPGGGNQAVSTIVIQPGASLVLLARTSSSVWAAVDGSTLMQYYAPTLYGITGSGGPLGGATNVYAYIASAGTTVTYTADEVVCETATGGTAYKVAAFSQALNISTTGAGGMDMGSAPASSVLAVYAMFNPATGAKTIVARATGATAPTPTYTYANAPSGYTASYLLGILTTNSSSQLVSFRQVNRKVWVDPVGVFGTTASGGAAWNSKGFSGMAPPGTKTISGYASASGTAAGSIGFNIGVAGDANGLGNQTTNVVVPSGGGASLQYTDIPCDTSQNLYLYYNAPTGSPTSVSYTFYATAYTF
jgi:hypothetical protein